MIVAFGDEPALRPLCRWLSALGEEVTALDPAAPVSEPAGWPSLAGISLLHVTGGALFGDAHAGVARSAVEAARAAGGAVSVDLSMDGFVVEDAARVAYRLAALRPAILFSAPAVAEALEAPLAGLAEVPVLRLPGGGCRIFERRLPSLGGDGSPESSAAFTAAFCAAYLEGATPLEAGARALVMAAQAGAAPARASLR
ncbi:MAG: hypothetical protein ACREPA_06080 [Candidatus Dormibacteraceae bacterium]